MSQSVPQPIDTGTPQQAYNHIGRSDSIGSAHSLGSFSMVSESALSYSRLERLPSWGSHTSSSTYPRDQYNTLSSVQTENTIQEGSYDRLARSPSTSSHNFSQSLVSDCNNAVNGDSPFFVIFTGMGNSPLKN